MNFLKISYPNNKIKQEIDYFIAGLDKEANRVASPETKQKIHNEYSDVFTGIRCFKCAFSFQVKDDAKPYQVPPRYKAYTLEEPFNKELERIQEHQLLAPLGEFEGAEWCNNVIMVPKPNGTVYLCLDTMWLNQAIIRPVHKGPTINNILSKVTYVCYMTLIDVSSGYQNLKLNKRSSYLTIFACHFAKYGFPRLPFEMVPARDSFQQNIDEIFKDLPNVFGLADNIIIVGNDTDNRDHDKSIIWVIKIC